jgi:hypothetical protein
MRFLKLTGFIDESENVIIIHHVMDDGPYLAPGNQGYLISIKRDKKIRNSRAKMQPSVFPRSRFCGHHLIPRDSFDFEDNDQLTQDHFDLALIYLQEIKQADLVKGDLIVFEALSGYRNSGLAIYDGSKIIDLDYEIDDYGALPQSFRVIEDGIPLDYWAKGEVNIGHNNIVWFNHTLVREECLKNLTYGLLDDEKGKKYAIFTTFLMNHQEYRIVLSYHIDDCLVGGGIMNEDDYHFHDEEVATIRLKQLRRILSADKLVPFSIESDFYSGNSTTLYLESFFSLEDESEDES